MRVRPLAFVWAGVRVISGGQTGADRAALDFALDRGLAHGGWCPRGRRAEDGRIPECYALRETKETAYAVRTERNVLEADATLILNLGELADGTLMTRQIAERHGKPWRLVALDGVDPDAQARGTLDWLVAHEVRTLNVAGPRESKRPGIHAAAVAFLERLWLFDRAHGR